jgi:FKBP-type peptidyl-prolyl cis-trans isomerase FklB
MKQFAFVVVFAGFFAAFTACGKVPRSGDVDMKNSTDSVSYALGYLEAEGFKARLKESPFDSLDVELVARSLAKSALRKTYTDMRIDQFGAFNDEVFASAFVNELAYDKSPFTEVTADAYLRAEFEKAMAKKQGSEVIGGGNQDNLQKGLDFLAENGKRAEVVTLASGLQYEVLVDGKGKKPAATDKVKCHYHGTSIDGKVFDSSVDRGTPAVFPVSGVIKGWVEALQLMGVGSKWKLYIPSHLAYGPQGAGNSIGANETLVFEVELLSIEE